MAPLILIGHLNNIEASQEANGLLCCQMTRPRSLSLKHSYSLFLRSFNVIEMSNKNQVINIDREDDSMISCVKAKRTEHLILVGLVVLA